VGGHDACTDGRLIQIPDVPDDPASRDLAWGYLAHEAAHVRYTVVRRALWASRLMLSETTDSFLTDSPTHRLTGSRTHRLTSSPYSNMSFFAHELRRRSVWA